jgi:hypothetical protein
MIVVSFELSRNLTALLASKPEGEKNLIGLTGDDDNNAELRRALEASLATASTHGQLAPQFGPSNRAPDPNWAMVPSNVGAISISRGCK